jgi:hypothetical protein
MYTSLRACILLTPFCHVLVYQSPLMVSGGSLNLQDDQQAAQYKEFMKHMRTLEENGAHTALLKMNRYMKRSAPVTGPSGGQSQIQRMPCPVATKVARRSVILN